MEKVIVTFSEAYSSFCTLPFNQLALNGIMELFKRGACTSSSCVQSFFRVNKLIGMSIIVVTSVF
jgi:hypothetical protein